MPITNGAGRVIGVSVGPVIETPRGRVIINSATMKAQLKWNASFQPTWQGQFSRAQAFVDSAVLAGCSPYVPLRTGMMEMSGQLGTQIGSGVVSWIAPYSHYQYYLKRKTASQTGALRGPYWFARWKPIGWPGVLAGARKIAGGQ